MATLLGDKNVGDIVRINEKGNPVDFIIVHKGNPDASLYDESCDGIWLLRLQAHSNRAFEYDNIGDYENSDIKSWLNTSYYNSIDSEIRGVIKEVKIPFKKGTGFSAAGVYSGTKGLLCNVFLLSSIEVGQLPNASYVPKDGVKLSYFLSAEDTDVASTRNSRRICSNSSGDAVKWWLRSPYVGGAGTHALSIGVKGGSASSDASSDSSLWARPAFVLPADLVVDHDGNVFINILPEITADKTGDLGMLTDGFDLEYSVNDDDGDPITVTEILDSTEVHSYTVTQNQNETYSLRGGDWLKISNGSHTFTLSASDGKSTVEHSVTFSRDQTSLSVTLDTPQEADDIIRFCSLAIEGSLPTDMVLTCEVTCNGLDDEPVWEDCTLKVKSGSVYMFKNQFAEKGFAFNFRINAKRGASGNGGYITRIYGGFE